MANEHATPEPGADEIEQRIRIRAYQIWESEGQPDGRAELHWDEAKEIVALEGVGSPVMSIEESTRATIEPSAAFENQG